MGDPLFLGVDLGSSSTKGVLVDADGAIQAVAELPHDISRPSAGWAEQDAERDWWESAAEVCRRLAGGHAGRVAAVGVCGLGPCLLPADGDGRPLRAAILYGIDTRAREQIERLTAAFGADEILARCGSVLSSQSVGPKLRWLAEREPEVWAATRHVFGAGSYLIFRLTGEYVLDHHSAGHWAPLYDVRRNGWVAEWVDDVAPGPALPRLVWPHEVSGRLTREAAAATGLAEGTPVAGGTVDSWAEVAASGVRGPGEGLLVYGTSMFMVEVHTPARLDPRLWGTVGFSPGALNVAAGVGSAGALAAWLRELTGAASFGELDREAVDAGPGAGGLLALPYFAGERAPLFDPDLRGALLGLTVAHRRGHIFRALLEATAFAVRQDLEAMRDAGATIGRLRGSGGGTSHELWPQIVSDVTGLAQEIRHAGSGASIGAAFFAAVATGAAALASEWRVAGLRVEPREPLRAVYDELYAQFRAFAQATLPQAHARASWQREHEAGAARDQRGDGSERGATRPGPVADGACDP